MRLRKDKSTRLEFQPASAVAPRWLSASTRWLVARVIWSRKPSTAAAAANTRNGLDTTRWRREHAAIDHRSIRTGCVGADANGLQMHQQILEGTGGDVLSGVPQLGVTERHRRTPANTRCIGLITRRSRVQIPPPLLPGNPGLAWVFCFRVATQATPIRAPDDKRRTNGGVRLRLILDIVAPVGGFHFVDAAPVGGFHLVGDTGSGRWVTPPGSILL